ncbi:MAG: hypothetical protein RIG62_28040 [Cyclobacteriaceae bacterium]
MKNSKHASFILMIGISLIIASCQEDVEILSRNDKVVQPAQPGDFTGQPGGQPYPTIIKQVYPVDIANYQECLAWRIEWPDYPAGVDPDMIPSFFATSTGTLNSLNFMNGTHPVNKKKLNFTLFTDEKIASANEVTDLWDWQGPSAEAVYFAKIKKTAEQIEAWVATRPSNFENYWSQAKYLGTEAYYEKGDFFIFQLPGQSPIRYGGIRIVSESPRIMEVYLAVPN